MYRVLGYSKCILDCNIDLEKLVMLCNTMGVRWVDVQVNVMVSDDDSVEFDDDENRVSSGCQQVVDTFAKEPNFYCHREHLLVGSTWSSGIREEGQKFEGGPIEFRNALYKYAIEIGF